MIDAEKTAQAMLNNMNRAMLDWLLPRQKWQVMADIKNQPFFGREKNPVMVKFRRPVPYIEPIPFQSMEGYDGSGIVPREILTREDVLRRYDPSGLFREEMLGEFAPDQRAIDLHDRLQKYYDDTPDCMHNSVAKKYWIEFNAWCKDHGYNNEDVQRAKRGELDMNRTTNKT